MSTVKSAAMIALVMLVGCGGAQSPASSPTPDGTSPASPERGPHQDDDTPAASQGTPDVPSQDLVDGAAAVDKGDLATAKSIAKRMRAKNASDGEAAHLEGLVAEKEGDRPRAEKAYAEALKLKPGFESSAVNLAALYLDEQNLDGAIDVAKSSLEKHPSSAPLHLDLGIALATKGDQQGATKELDAATRATPDDPMLLLTYGHWLGAWKLKDAAATKLRAARAAAKGDVGMLAGVAHEMHGIGALADCVTTLDTAIGVKDAAELRTERAACKLGGKDAAGAVDDLKTAVQNEPKYAPAHFYLGRALAETNDFKGSIAEYEAFMKLEPKSPLVKVATARIAEAKSHLKR